MIGQNVTGHFFSRPDSAVFASDRDPGSSMRRSGLVLAARVMVISSGFGAEAP